ncbi:hypothetical protein K432DRAFT_68166 [Lepidopterella palustris CBS 459.81]|uniref:Uncharacterized protein n=1 Tax=Lepidopterella palustris CBS 459.81 TaxID=1314670 RepID=A0A8E2E8U5_9PEZI|nr:hypothetical protein K432DRAFT_68166 [Lepidopterella palustris CBS 459.81]
MDTAYITYIDSVPTLSSALTALGRSWHQELNAPVYSAIEAFAQALHGYGSDLLSSSLISTDATIRTIHVAGTLSDAQSAWSKILNYPSGANRGGYFRKKKRAADPDTQPAKSDISIERRDRIIRRNSPPRKSTEGRARSSDGGVRQAVNVAMVMGSEEGKATGLADREKVKDKDGDKSPTPDTPVSGTSAPAPHLCRRRVGTVVGRSIVPWA